MGLNVALLRGPMVANGTRVRFFPSVNEGVSFEVLGIEEELGAVATL